MKTVNSCKADLLFIELKEEEEKEEGGESNE